MQGEGGRVGGWEGGRVGREKGGEEGGERERRKEGECRSERGTEKGVLGMSVYVCIGYKCVLGKSVVCACRRMLYHVYNCTCMYTCVGYEHHVNMCVWYEHTFTCLHNAHNHYT